MQVFRPKIGRRLEPIRDRRETESPAARAARIERARFYNGTRWRRLARRHLAANPLCVFCGRLTELVDHVAPRLDRPDLAYDPANLRSCCRACHSRFGEKHMGGGGRGRKGVCS